MQQLTRSIDEIIRTLEELGNIDRRQDKEHIDHTFCYTNGYSSNARVHVMKNVIKNPTVSKTPKIPPETIVFYLYFNDIARFDDPRIKAYVAANSSRIKYIHALNAETDADSIANWSFGREFASLERAQQELVPLDAKGIVKGGVEIYFNDSRKEKHLHLYRTSPPNNASNTEPTAQPCIFLYDTSPNVMTPNRLEFVRYVMSSCAR